MSVGDEVTSLKPDSNEPPHVGSYNRWSEIIRLTTDSIFLQSPMVGEAFGFVRRQGNDCAVFG